MMKRSLFFFLFLLFSIARAELIFLEAETAFVPSSDGWAVNQNHQARGASLLATLNGAGGEKTGKAVAPLLINEAGEYRIWLRHIYHSTFRGPFTLTLSKEGKSLGEKVFDTTARDGVKNWLYVWDYFDVALKPGEYELVLSKYEDKNCSSYIRNVDCLLVTTDKEVQPDHLQYGPQTWVRVTLGEGYEKPTQLHIFADHYRAPWYGHWHLSKAGTASGFRYSKQDALLSGESTPWCNLTPMIYQDSGAILNFTARYTYRDWADRLNAKFEFATAPDDSAIVRTLEIDADPNGLILVMPPNLETEENLVRFKRDADFARETGKIADAYDWPTAGKFPERIPFYLTATVGGYGTPVDQEIMDREWKTIDYFGFSNRNPKQLKIHGHIWNRKNGSFCQPDIEKMKSAAADYAAEFREEGKSAEDIQYCMLTDEPTGQPSSFIVKDPAYRDAFRVWLKELGKTPEDLLVTNWEEVVPVLESERDEHPGLHYFTQRFRTRALGDFMATQRDVLEEAYEITDLPTLVNFSDGAVYTANMYSQGVDYFELLDSPDQNAIWSEDWSNGASSYQCAAFNVELMRAAARGRDMTLGHFLIAYAGRKPWDIKLKAASETARGIRVWQMYSWGVPWGTHTGGPTWNNHAIYSKPEIWGDCAEVVREIGAAEDLIIDAEPLPAEVAILYSTSSDIWQLKKNHAYGFDRMHTWMALSHAQIPADIVAERQIEMGALDSYRVCYLSGENLTRATAEKLATWVEGGGTLVLTAGAASRDEFNRPLTTLERLIPAKREAVEVHQNFLNSGSYVHILKSKESVSAGEEELEVLSVSQAQAALPDSKVIATFSSGEPATISGKAGKGRVISHGYLPALSYIKGAIDSRRGMLNLTEDQVNALKEAAIQSDHPAPPVVLTEEGASTFQVDDPRLERSYNPWDFSSAIRDIILQPVRDIGIEPLLSCELPLIDALPLYSNNGIVIPLANYTLEHQKAVTLRVKIPEGRKIDRVTSIYHGDLDSTHGVDNRIEFTLPLDATDYVQIYFIK
ncbi:beta-galactosidase [Verrucomicrobiales bacterium]|nr:beta-galactosidase [Verrucomicrobiales bacterium]